MLGSLTSKANDQGSVGPRVLVVSMAPVRKRRAYMVPPAKSVRLPHTWNMGGTWLRAATGVPALSLKPWIATTGTTSIIVPGVSFVGCWRRDTLHLTGEGELGRSPDRPHFGTARASVPTSPQAPPAW